jgi:hypothetical protein
MDMTSEEHRIAALLRELIQRSGKPAAEIETSLGWEHGHLSELLAEGVSFEALLEVLAALDATPGDFFARLHGFNGRDEEAGGDRRFEESRRVVKAALARRSGEKNQGKPAQRAPT